MSATSSAAGSTAGEWGSDHPPKPRSSPSGVVLLGATGPGPDWSALRAHAEDRGWPVELFDAQRPDDGDEVVVDPPVAGVGAAVVLVDGPDEPGARHLARVVGALGQGLGRRSVLVLVESGSAGVLEGTGLPEVVYERGAIHRRFANVDALVGAAAGGPAAAPRRRPMLPWSGWRPEVWLVASLGLIVCVFAGLVVYDLGGRADLAADDQPAGPTADVDGSAVAQDPAGPAGDTEVGSVDGLPSRCVVELVSGQSPGPVVPCGGRGQLTVVAAGDPWVGPVATISGGASVTGEVELEPLDGGPGVIVRRLRPGNEVSLDDADIAYRVRRLDLLVGANGQTVTVTAAEPAAGWFELTFTVDPDA